MSTARLADRVLGVLTDLSKNLSKPEYLELLDIIGSDIDGRMDCVRDEIADEAEVDASEKK